MQCGLYQELRHVQISTIFTKNFVGASLGQRRIERILYMFCKINHGDAPSYLCDMLPQTVDDRNDYTLYSGLKMDRTFTRLKCYR